MVDTERSHTKEAAPAVTDESLAKVRDLLFGEQVRAHQARFADVEASLVAETERLRGELDERLATLERGLRDEVDRLDSRIRDEVAARRVGEAELRSLLDENKKALEARIAAEREHARESLAKLDARLTTTHSELSDALEQRVEALGARLDDACAELREDKMDRAELSGLLTELARRVGGTEA